MEQHNATNIVPAASPVPQHSAACNSRVQLIYNLLKLGSKIIANFFDLNQKRDSKIIANFFDLNQKRQQNHS